MRRGFSLFSKVNQGGYAQRYPSSLRLTREAMRRGTTLLPTTLGYMPPCTYSPLYMSVHTTPRTAVYTPSDVNVTTGLILRSTGIGNRIITVNKVTF